MSRKEPGWRRRLALMAAALLGSATMIVASPMAASAEGGQYEAEDAALSGGAVVETEHSGYSGTGFVGGFTDANAGTAQVAFTITVAEGGPTALELRYANGTPTTRTLSLEIDGESVGQVDFPATGGWAQWGQVSVSHELEAGEHVLRLAYGAGDNGNLNLDRLDVVALGSPEPPVVGEAEDAYLSGGVTRASATSGYTGSGYASGFAAEGARLVRTVVAEEASTAQVTIRFATTGAARSLALLVNGRTEGAVDFATGDGWRVAHVDIPLRSGVNTVGLRAAVAGADVLIDSIQVDGEVAAPARGATTPFAQYEAEDGVTTGTVLAPSRTYGEVATEASGRSAVRLDAAGEDVTVTLTAPADGLVVRFSLPDSPDGTGLTAPLAVYADGQKVADLSLSSAHSWLYGAYPYVNDPGAPATGPGCEQPTACLPHRFFDEQRIQLPEVLSQGTQLTLRQDAPGAAPLDIDLIEAELVPSPLERPGDALSIADFGAVPGADATAALTAAVAQASADGVAVWIPEGVFPLSSAVELSDVAVLGAGPWYSALAQTGARGGLFGSGGGVTIADLRIDGDATVRQDDASDSAIEGDFAAEALIQNVWIQHTKTGLWVRPGSQDLLAVGLRVRDTYADGVNLRSASNTHVVHSTFRNTGDDAMAMWSSDGPGSANVFAFNTVQLPVLSNGIAVYGGADNRVEDNLVADTVTAGAGISISTRFGVPFSGTTSVQRNTLERTGSLEQNWQDEIGALWLYADVHPIDAPVIVRELTIRDSTFSGLYLSWEKSVQGVVVEDSLIADSGTYGIEIETPGSITVRGTTVQGSGAGGALVADGHVLVDGGGNTGL